MNSFFLSRAHLIWTVTALLAAAALLSACAGKAYTKDAEEIRAVGDAISAYTVPQGYSEAFATDVMGYQLVSLQGPLPSCHIYLAQAPEGVEIDAEKLRQQARKMGSGNQGETRDLRLVEEREVSLRGETVAMMVSEGRNSDNLPYREVTAVFAGRGGQALLSISAPVEVWDWELVDQFIASLS